MPRTWFAGNPDIFPSIPTISPAMWKAVQEMDVRRILLCYVEQSGAARQIWLRVADDIAAMGDMDTALTEKIRMWHEQGGTVELRVKFATHIDSWLHHAHRRTNSTSRAQGVQTTA